ncbi:MAG: N-acetyltransferase [Candidatus Riflebacteria bacterium]|nr:N-acetyltransferase [Candidatus Riflebacteria bacterium]
MNLSTLLEVGSGAIVDESALLGYVSGRLSERKLLKIGSRARVRSGSVIYEGSTIGDGLETGHNVVIREENRIGSDFKIWNSSVVDYGCWIGDNVRLHNHIYIAQYTTIEDDVFMAPGVMVANDPCPVCTLCMKGPTIRRGARIGINVTLLPHIEIGADSLIAAGAVVTRDVPPRSLVVGNPGRVVKKIDEIECFVGVKPRAYPEAHSDRGGH